MPDNSGTESRHIKRLTPEQMETLADLIAEAYAIDGTKRGGENVQAVLECARELTDARTVSLAKQAGWVRRDGSVDYVGEDDE